MSALTSFLCRAGQVHRCLCFIHGGYWRALKKEDSVFMAKTFTDRGIAVASINYQLSPEASLEDIVAQCRRVCCMALQKRRCSTAWTRARMVLAGSSAGAHLAAMVMAPGLAGRCGHAGRPSKCDQGRGIGEWACLTWHRCNRQPPTTGSSLTLSVPGALSPIHLLPPSHTQLCIATAELDTDEFKRQSVAYAAACSQQGVRCNTLRSPDAIISTSSSTG